MNSNYKILVAEDDHLNQVLMRADLKSKGYEIKIVSNGLEAVEECLANVYDLVLMDIAMPVLDGIGAAKNIRQKGIEMPIIAVTTFDEEDLGDAPKDAGINGYIRKPYRREDLYSSIQQMVG